MTDDLELDRLALATFAELNRHLGDDSIADLDRELGCGQLADGAFVWETPSGSTYWLRHGTAFCRRSVADGAEITCWRDGVEISRFVADTDRLDEAVPRDDAEETP